MQRESKMFDYRGGSVAASAFVLLLALLSPVLAVNYVPGVKEGDYVFFGNFVGVNLDDDYDWEKFEVVSVTGKEVTLYASGQLVDGTPIANTGWTVYNVETGVDNETHSFLPNVIASNLNQGDVVPSPEQTLIINKTEIRTYMGVSRTVNLLSFEETNEYRYSMVYDKESGMVLEIANMFYTPVGQVGKAISYNVVDTNIFSPQPPQSGFSPYLYLTFAVASIAVAATGVVVFKKRRKPEAKTVVPDEKQIDLPYNLSGVSRGECYLADSLQHCLRIVSDLYARGISALAIVREDPEFIVKNYNLKPEEVVLLSSKPIKGFKAVDSLQDISIALMKFLKTGGGAVLLDGLEYLISRFGFNPVYMCLQEKRIEFLEAGAVLLVPVNMETLDSREKGQLLSELKLL
jgi:hypothetical protein